MTKSSGSGTLRRLLRYAWPAKHILVVPLVSTIATALLDLAVPWVMGFLLIDGVVKARNVQALPFVVAILAGVFVGQKIASFLQDYVQELAQQRMVHALRCNLFAYIHRLPLRVFDEGRTGDLLARLTSDIDTIEGLIGTVAQDIGVELMTLVATVSFLIAVNPRLTAFVLPTVPALVLSVWMFRPTIKTYSRRARDLVGSMAALAAETLGGIRVVKAFGAESFEGSRFGARSEQLLRMRVSNAKLRAGYSSLVDLCVFGGTLIVILVATPRVVGGTMTLGAFVAYLGYLNKMYSPAKKLAKANLSIQKILAAGDRVFELMEQPLEQPAYASAIHEAGDCAVPANSVLSNLAETGMTTGGLTALTLRLEGRVRFERVAFGYADERTVLRDFSLDVAPGEMVALVGPSGSGKTTIVNLLLRFYRASTGTITIDGIPIDELPLDLLRRQIGLVQQETFLFSGTIRDNIAYAKASATDDQILAAARDAQAHEFIARLPNGYSTAVGERGVTLSGGQRQRIAIARALLYDPPILIFDEATSHLDSHSEHLVQQALERIARSRTVFVIAHRLSTIYRADKIVVIENGSVSELGRHDQLLDFRGTYRKLFALQTDNQPETISA